LFPDDIIEQCARQRRGFAPPIAKRYVRILTAPNCRGSGCGVLPVHRNRRGTKQRFWRAVKKGGRVIENWRNRKTLILSRTDMMGLLTPAEYIGSVEQAFRMHGEGRFCMDPKGHIVLDKYPGEWETMPSYIEEPEAAACKWVSIRERNRAQYDLPTVFSILIYTHPETGFPLAICDGSYHTLMRTGAAAAVSAKWLARKNAKRLAIVGAGHMAEGTLATCNVLFPWEEVRVWSRTQATLDHFTATQEPKYPQLKLRTSTNLADVVRGADVVVTVTPARAPIVMNDWIAPGTHIAALGADKGGDQELDPKILQRARIYVDDIRQCRTDGEVNVPLRQGLIGEKDIAGEIGEVITGRKPGRSSDGEITLFDSTGIALQDSATVPLEYERAVAAGVGVEKKMIST
jgi:alanine dehydrogenase